MRIFSRRQSGAIPHFDRMIVEPSGLADPAPIAQAILRQPALSRVDAAGDDRHRGGRRVRPAPAGRASGGAQAGRASPIIRLVSKGDLADTGAAGAAVAADQCGRAGDRHAQRRDRPGACCSPPPSCSLAVRFRRLPNGWTATGSARRTGTITGRRRLPSRCWPRRRCTGRVSTGGCAPCARPRMRTTLLRVKGILAIAGRPRPVVIQGVHHVLHPPAELPSWPGGDHRSRLVMIVRGSALAAEIEASWQAVLPDVDRRSVPRESDRRPCPPDERRLCRGEHPLHARRAAHVPRQVRGPAGRADRGRFPARRRAGDPDRVGCACTVRRGRSTPTTSWPSCAGPIRTCSCRAGRWSIPWRGRNGLEEIERAIKTLGLMGVKYQPPVQALLPVRPPVRADLGPVAVARRPRADPLRHHRDRRQRARRPRVQAGPWPPDPHRQHRRRVPPAEHRRGASRLALDGGADRSGACTSATSRSTSPAGRPNTCRRR